MKLLHQKLRLLVLLSSLTGLFFLATGTPLAQTETPSRTNHVNDFAGVIDGTNRQRLENLLSNLQLLTGIQFDVATVQTTSGQEIFDYSKALAREWNVGARNTVKKSLLLVVAVDEKAAFTQFSRSVQSSLPEGSLGEMAQRLRTLISDGQFNLALSSSIENFVTALGNKLAFKIEDLDKPSEQSSEQHVSVALKTSATIDEPTQVPQAPQKPLTTSPTRKRQVKPSSPPVDRTPLKRASSLTTRSAPVSDEDESEEVELTLTLPLPDRIQKLKEFLSTRPNSKSRPRAFELLVSSRAALGDQQLKNSNSKDGVEQLMLAVDEAPSDVSEKLYSGVIAQIPMNLYMRNESAAAFKAAQNIETKFGNDPNRLLALTSFYLGIERGDEAVRLATKAVELAPTMAQAHYLLGVALHISLRLDEAAAEYKRAIELDENLRTARRSLADLNRASGKSEEALAFYREQVGLDAKDKAARAGLVICLFDLGRSEEGNKELNAALQDDPSNVTLLAGISYWLAAHNDTKRALELASRAVELEPRYTWSQIALARALVGEKKPLQAERALRFARQYGKFPTLDYELATVLAAVGLYEEASEVLTQSFVIKDGEIETRLGGRMLTKASNFIELLAPERRASLFQSTPADTQENARILKALLAFTAATADSENGSETVMAAAGKDFATGDDHMRAYRQVYVASRLLRLGKGLNTARELLDAARTSADDALDVPAVTVAVQADELRAIRSRAIASGATPDVPEAPRNALSNIFRGRIDDLSGWILFNQDKPAESIDYLRRAVRVIPENTPAWRTACWHLGVSLEQTGKNEEALASYIKSYNAGEPDPTRRALIEKLYVKVNGSPAGLDERLQGGSATLPASSSEAPAQTAPTNAVNDKPADAPPSATTTPTTEPAAATSTPESNDVPKNNPPLDTSRIKSELTAAEKTTPSAEPTPSPEPTRSATTTASSEPSLSDVTAPARTRLKLTGSIKDASGKGIANVVVVLISPRGSVLASTTDTEGNYSFTVSPSEKPFRLLPSKEGFVFDPIDKTVVIFSDDQKDVNFVGTAQRPSQ